MIGTFVIGLSLCHRLESGCIEVGSCKQIRPSSISIYVALTGQIPIRSHEDFCCNFTAGYSLKLWIAICSL